MFAKILSIGRVAAMLTMAVLLSADLAQAQQNSVVFPWNSGYQGSAQPQVFTPPVDQTPALAQPAAVAPIAPSASNPSTTGEEQEVADAGHAMIDLRVPANAEIWFEGDKTQQKGSLRHFISPALETGRMFTYDVRARWTDPNGKVVDQTRKVKVEAGQRAMVNFNTPAPDAEAKPQQDNLPKPLPKPNP